MIKKLIFSIIFLCSVTIVIAQNNSSVEDTSDITFTKVEVEADFPGGIIAWKNFLMKNLKADVPVKRRAPAGSYTVVVRFIVWKNGRIENIVSETNYGYGMEKEVMRVIKKGPKWIPAMQDGKIVKAYRRQPVTFVISEE